MSSLSPTDLILSEVPQNKISIGEKVCKAVNITAAAVSSVAFGVLSYISIQTSFAAKEASVLLQVAATETGTVLVGLSDVLSKVSWLLPGGAAEALKGGTEALSNLSNETLTTLSHVTHVAGIASQIAFVAFAALSIFLASYAIYKCIEAVRLSRAGA